jgi:methylthioribose-1-phosphate isomerase
MDAGDGWAEAMDLKIRELRGARPTAVNLAVAVDRMAARARVLPRDGLVEGLDKLAREMEQEDAACCRAIGELGQTLLSDGDRVLTHCNAGALATVGIGTALGVIRSAVGHGKRIHVLADETRPVLQGARLTAAELMADGIPVTLLCDGMAGWMMKTGRVDKVIVGADRIAANGDTANKIGTYSVAVLARHHGIPFYVAAPLSTLDVSLPDGEGIPIEERDGREVTRFMGAEMAPRGVAVVNPAFDVTPSSLIDAIVTERGILRPPYRQAIRSVLAG